MLRLNPGFAVVALLSLALGVGANSAIFQLLDAVRLRTLPVARPSELARVRVATPDWNPTVFRGAYPEITNPQWELIRDRQQVFSRIAAVGSYPVNLAKGGEGRSAEGLFVSGDFFDMLEVKPLLGRLLTASDDHPGCGSSGTVISYGFWQREFGGDPGVVGRTLTMNDHSYQIVGVTPATFFGVEVGRPYDLAVPICSQGGVAREPSVLTRRELSWLAVIGRLRPGWNRERASAQLAAISPGIFRETAPSGYAQSEVAKYLRLTLGVFPVDHGFSRLRDRYEDSLWVLLSVAGTVLLIACANLANLMLARAGAREREIAVRIAIGASRGRLVRQLLAESLLLALLGAAFGWFLAQALSRFLLSLFNSLGARGSVYSLDLRADWRAIAFTLGVAVLTCVLFGLGPAFRGTRVMPAVMLAGGRALTPGRERFTLRRTLVVVQVALSFALVVSALLFARTLGNLLTLNAGFREEGLLVATLDFARLNLPRDQLNPFKRQLLEQVTRLPGVTSAAETAVIPLTGGYWRMDILTDAGAKPRSSMFNWVSPEFFETVETPILAGRAFDARDTEASPRVVIVNEAFSKAFFPGVDPLGRTFQSVAEANYPQTVYRIVGLAKDSKYQDIRENFQPIVYAPQEQHPNPASFQTLLVRFPASPAVLVAAIKNLAAGVNPEIRLNFDVLRGMVLRILLRERLMASLSGLFGILAIVLATVGLYGVTSYIVIRRTREIGIRMALGAGPVNIVRMILSETAALVAIGLLLGTVLAFFAATTVEKLLFGLPPRDPASFAGAAVLLALTALLAGYFPARKAARLHPMDALRQE
jgi:putative ABC transport system permease protein